MDIKDLVLWLAFAALALTACKDEEIYIPIGQSIESQTGDDENTMRKSQKQTRHTQVAVWTFQNWKAAAYSLFIALSSTTKPARKWKLIMPLSGIPQSMLSVGAAINSIRTLYRSMWADILPLIMRHLHPTVSILTILTSHPSIGWPLIHINLRVMTTGISVLQPTDKVHLMPTTKHSSWPICNLSTIPLMLVYGRTWKLRFASGQNPLLAIRST